MDEIELLREYATRNSEAAFAELVNRRIGFVYSAALRQTGDAHLAEEITQAVFILLARKAGKISEKTILTGWLFRATRFVALAQMRAAAKHQRLAKELQMQTDLSYSPTDPLWEQLSPRLDEALATLNEKDRQAILLRYFDNKSLAEIGSILGTGENAAAKRTGRALDKLHKLFLKRGIRSTTETMAGALAGNSIQPVPAALAKMVTAAALAKGASASLSTLILIKGAVKIMAWTKAKTVIAVGVAAVIAGAGTYLVYHLATAHAYSSKPAVTDSVPIQIDNDDFRADGDQNGTFVVEVDPDTRRTTNSPPAIHIGGPLGPDGSSILPSPDTINGTYKKTDNSSSTRYLVTDSSALYGKHIRVTGWLKTKDVRGWVGAFVIILGTDGRHYQFDDMSDRPIRGTTDWQQIEIDTDLPDEACVVYFGPDLYGPGEVWGDDFQITLAPAGTANTDDRNWRIASEADPIVYAEETDFDVTHNGHPATRLTYTPNGVAPRGTHIRFAHDFYGSDSDKYCGHTVRMSGWIKTENVSGSIAPVILPYAGWYKLLGKYHNDYIPKGTSDWTQFSVTCAVPEDTEYLNTGFNFYGSGKAWIDTDSIKYEIIK